MLSNEALMTDINVKAVFTILKYFRHLLVFIDRIHFRYLDSEHESIALYMCANAIIRINFHEQNDICCQLDSKRTCYLVIQLLYISSFFKG